MDSFQATSWALSVLMVCGFALAAYLRARRERVARGGTDLSTDFFVTARGSQSRWRIAFSFFASAMGSWAIVGPAAYVSYAGLLGLVLYSLSAGLPFLLIVAFGGRMLEDVPDCSSVTGWVRWRFGAAAARLTTLLTLFNMSVALLAEYATLGALFEGFVGTSKVPAVLLLGAVTMIYTAVGGLSVSIWTDRAQGATSLVLISVLVVFVASTWSRALPKPLTDAQLGFTRSGFSALLTMPASLLSASLFSDALYQRVWASEDASARHFGAALGALGVVLAVFTFGFLGFLALWSGAAIPGVTNPNLYTFALLGNAEEDHVSSWPGVAAIVAAVVMSESAIDTIQNGIAATLSDSVLSGRPVRWSRAGVVLVNLPLLVFACFHAVEHVLDLFLLVNMVCVCASPPLVAGLLTPLGGTPKYAVGERSFVLALMVSALSVTLYGVGDAGWAFGDGIRLAWYANDYAYDYFLCAIFSSLAGVALGARWDATTVTWRDSDASLLAPPLGGDGSGGAPKGESVHLAGLSEIHTGESELRPAAVGPIRNEGAALLDDGISVVATGAI